MSRTRPRHTPTLVCVIAAVTGLIVHGQAQSPPQGGPVFFSRADLVRLEVSVLDKNRRPVRGLTVADFSVSEDGTLQDITAFESLDVPEHAQPAATWMRDVPPDVVTNDTNPGHLLVIAIDDALIPQEPAIIKSSKQAVEHIIDKLGPDDLAAIVFTGDNRQAQDFTNDRSKLLATLNKFNPGLANWKGGSAHIASTDQDLQFYLSSVNTLLNVVDAFAVMPHSRKTLIWITPGIPIDLEGVGPVKATTPRDGTEKTMMTGDIHLRLSDLTKKVFETARRANVPIYPIDPCGLFGLKLYVTGGHMEAPDLPNAPWVRAMSNIVSSATNTGGHAIINTNDLAPGIESIFEENSSYYLIGYVPSNAKSDGSLRRLEVKVNRKDVVVRTNSGYYTAKGGASQPPRTPNADLSDALASPIPVRGVPLKATVAAFAIPNSRNAVVSIALGIREPVPSAAANGRVTLTTDLKASAFTNEGEPRGTLSNTARVVVREGAQGDADYEALSRIDLPPGRYRLRLAAHLESIGTTGTVVVDLVIPDFNGDRASLSGVVVGAEPGRPSAPRDLLTGVVPLIPTAQRTFRQSDQATALFYLYQNGKQGIAPGKVMVRVVDEHNEARVTESRDVGIDRFVSAAGNRALRSAEFEYRIPLDRLTIGRYLLTFEATIAKSVMRRDVEFEIR